MLSVFIAGLKKGCGKTLIASGLAGTMQSLSYVSSYYKPIETGAYIFNNKPQAGDINKVNKIDPNIKTLATYSFCSISTPLIGAYNSGIKKIELSKIYNDYKLNTQMTECHIVEGSNSISTPIDEKFTEIDIIKTIGIPVVLVLNPEQSSIDDVISGINYLYSNKINLFGVIINNYAENTVNLEYKYYPQLVKEYTHAKVWGCFPKYENFDSLKPETIIADTLNCLNIEEIFGIKISKLN